MDADPKPWIVGTENVFGNVPVGTGTYTSILFLLQCKIELDVWVITLPMLYDWNWHTAPCSLVVCIFAQCRFRYSLVRCRVCWFFYLAVRASGSESNFVYTDPIGSGSTTLLTIKCVLICQAERGGEREGHRAAGGGGQDQGARGRQAHQDQRGTLQGEHSIRVTNQTRYATRSNVMII
jgi:hypothetical protein